MTDVSLGTVAVLGTSSDHPRLDVIDMETGEVRTIAEHAPGNGIYAVSRCVRGLAYATRGGITRYTNDFLDVGGGPVTWKTLSPKGPQSLSVCLNRDFAATSDTSGAHLWFDLDAPDPPCLTLDTRGQTICALASLGEFVIGLGALGGLRVWRASDGVLVDAVESPAPPRRYALINLVQCFGQAVTYPAESGHLVTFILQDLRVDTFPAHQSEFYAVAALPEGLLTSGSSDGLVLLRQKSAGGPAGVLRGPYDIIAGAALAGITLTVLLIDVSGTARVYRQEGDELHLVCELPQTGYRSVAGPSPAELAAATTRQKTDETRRIVRDLESRGTSLPPEEVYEIHERLAALGAEPVSLEIRAQEAQRNQALDPKEILVELELRARQARLLEGRLEARDPRVLRAYMRYFDLLKELRQWEVALHLAERLAGISSNTMADDKIERLYQYVKATRCGDAVVDLGDELPFGIVVGAADILGRPMRGMFAVARFSPISCGDAADHPDLVLSKYAWVRPQVTHRSGGLPTLTWREAWWLDASGGYRCETLFAAEDAGLDRPHWVLAFPLRPLSWGPVPVLALDAGPGPSAASPVAETAAYNARILDVHRRIDAEGKAATWSRWTYRAVCQAVTAAANEMQALVLQGRRST